MHLMAPPASAELVVAAGIRWRCRPLPTAVPTAVPTAALRRASVAALTHPLFALRPSLLQHQLLPRHRRQCCRLSASLAGSDEPSAIPPSLSLSLSSGDESSPSSSSSGGEGGGDVSSGSSAFESDGEGGVRLDLQLPRRSLLVKFTCNKCSGRSERLVNPIAWQRGMVIARCQHCEAWHKLADAANLVEEIRYADLEDE